MAEAIGHRVWAIAEGYIPPSSTGNTRQLVSHEAVCILNAGDTDADVEITVYFAEREPAGPYAIRVPARRTRHVRFNDLERAGADPGRHRLFECDRIERSRRRPTHAARFAPASARAFEHHRLSRPVTVAAFSLCEGNPQALRSVLHSASARSIRLSGMSHITATDT